LIRGGELLSPGAGKKEVFFFEKKNQKTFARYVWHRGSAGNTRAARNM
jgi:hypothetical protein